MKTILKSSLVLLLFSAAIVIFEMSCKKDSVAQCPTPTYPIAGLWIGTYQTNQVTHQPLYYSFVINPDGTLIVKTKGNPPAQAVVYATGTWVLTGNVFAFTSATLNYSSIVSQKGTLTYNNTGTLTAGTWQNTTSDNGIFYTGTFPSMARVN
ncbi:MAG: hypothetical protein H7Z13_18230 [Ferruginibacter sp.]|nr:hypothetical protein [Ferruginibacter sp.]